VSQPFIGEIKMLSLNFAPKNWALCNGQLLPINQNQPLFSLLGTSYGGDGRTTFALPDLRARMPLHVGNGLLLGNAGGEESHVLSPSELPQHAHLAGASSGAATALSPNGAVWANTGKQSYAAVGDTAMDSTAVSAVGSSQPHDNMPPFLVITFVIALAGVFPSQT
jgi:microcystin-dependent protein